MLLNVFFFFIVLAVAREFVTLRTLCLIQRALFFVGLNVGSQVAGEGEPFVADLAFVWLVSCMQEYVVLKICLFAKSSIANMTLIGPRSGVDVHVTLQVTRRWERLRAKGAFMRLFLAVCHPMIIKVRGSGEAFPANVALVRFFSTVDAPMCVKRARRGEPFSTNVADVRLLSGVCAHVPS